MSANVRHGKKTQVPVVDRTWQTFTATPCTSWPASRCATADCPHCAPTASWVARARARPVICARKRSQRPSPSSSSNSRRSTTAGHGEFACTSDASRCNSEGTMLGAPSKSIGILGYNAEEKVYTYAGTDSSGNAMTSVPRGTLTGDTWTYDDESMMGGQKMKSRVTIKELSPTAYAFKMEMQGADGKWITAMESKSTKLK